MQWFPFGLLLAGCTHSSIETRDLAASGSANDDDGRVRVVDLLPTRAGVPVSNLASKAEVRRANDDPALGSFSFTALPFGGRGFVEWHEEYLLCGDSPPQQYGASLALDLNDVLALGRQLERLNRLELETDAAQRGDADVARETWLIVSAHESPGETWENRLKQSKDEGVALAHRLLDAGAFVPPIVVTVIQVEGANGGVTFGSYPIGDSTSLSDSLPIVTRGPPPDPAIARSLFESLLGEPSADGHISDGLPVEVHLGTRVAQYNASIAEIAPDDHQELLRGLRAIFDAHGNGCRINAPVAGSSPP